MNGVLGLKSALWGYTGLGRIWVREMNFGMNHVPGAGSIIELLTCSPVCCYCAMTAPNIWKDINFICIHQWCNSTTFLTVIWILFSSPKSIKPLVILKQKKNYRCVTLSYFLCIIQYVLHMPFKSVNLLSYICNNSALYQLSLNLFPVNTQSLLCSYCLRVHPSISSTIW